MNSMKRQKDMILKDEAPESVDLQNTTGKEWRNNSRKNEEPESQQNDAELWLCLAVQVKSDAVKSNTAQEPGMLGP